MRKKLLVTAAIALAVSTIGTVPQASAQPVCDWGACYVFGWFCC